MLLVFVILIAILTILFTTQYFFFGLDLIFAENLSISLIASSIILIPTLFVLDILIKRHDSRMLMKIEKERYLETLGTRHDLLVSNLERLYVHYVTKEPAVTNESLKVKEDEFEKLVNDLESYITPKFLNENYKILFHGGNGVFDFREIEVTYPDFFVSAFRDKIYSDFTEYVSRYSSLLPSEVLESIFKIEDTLKQDNFAMLSDHGISDTHFKITEFEPQVFIEPISTIGKEIIRLRKYLNS